ncbi:MAG: Ni/Fe-hydrogenase cytochrome b subunit [Desulfobacterales bacterium]|jgi:Ni/Fe-hydrogenase subunit HybB-like protein|nr:Ni/Fe-hydrogenase cytochrome b subunit [Desulfobacterales bacterium]
MSAHPGPIRAPFWTPGVLVLAFLMAAGAVAVLARFIGGIGYVSNLSTARPWGIWIGIDVASGVALAAGGFTTAFLAHILGRHTYEPVVRPALLTAMLGYTFVVLGLIVDIGRSWAIWKPMIHWNFHSVLFEVAMCVMFYLNVLYIEFIPIVVERFRGRVNLPGPLAALNRPAETLLGLADAILPKIMWIFIIAGVVLSCMHQSSLGSLMLIAPTKLHPLWYTPILPLLFLTSAIAVGYPMVVFETTLATTSLKLDPEMQVLSPLTRFTVVLLGIYLALKIGDMVIRGTYVYLLDGTAQTNAFLAEMILGVLAPWLMLLSPAVRRSRRWLFIACTLIVGGVLLNRVNVFVVAYRPPVSENYYFPSVTEILITVGFIAGLMFLYRFLVNYLPVLNRPGQEVSA